MIPSYIKSLWLTVLFMVAAPPALLAKTKTINGIDYTVLKGNNNAVIAQITTHANGDVEILSEVNIDGQTYIVTRIGKAFYQNDRISSVLIPPTVTQIDKGAFRGCVNLTKLVIPSKPILVEAGAFEKCTQIKQIITAPRRYSDVSYVLAAIPNPSIVEPDVPNDQIIVHHTDTVKVKEVIKVGKDLCALTLKCTPSFAEARLEGMDAVFSGTAMVPNLDEGTYSITFSAEGYEPQTVTVILKEGEKQECVAELKEKAKPSNTLALIIANEEYESNEMSRVLMAKNDGKGFEQFCLLVLGLPKENIIKEENASLKKMNRALDRLRSNALSYQGDVNILVYYSGHGMPDESSKDAYLMGWEADGLDTEGCLALNDLYGQLESIQAKNVCVFIDACFSGSGRDGKGINTKARKTLLKPNEIKPKGNMIVFSASKGNQVAMPYEAEGHGLFTYFLLKKLNETRGRVTLGELSEYVKKEVTRCSWEINGKEQTPTVEAGDSQDGSWQKVQLLK